MSLELLADLVVLILVLCTTAIVLLGWGNLTWRLLDIEQPNKPSVMTVWLGFCVVIGCVEIVHLFAPVDWKVTFAVALTGLIGYGLNSKSIFSLKDSHPTDVLTTSGILSVCFSTIRCHPLRSLLATIVVIVWCLCAMELPTMYDSGLYHFGSIRWLNEHPIVPGLGNLHWRLALNQSYFAFLALLNIAPFWGKGYAAGGLFLLLLTLLTILEVGATQSKMWRWIFGGVLFSYLCLLSGPIANPMPDTAVALLQIVIFIFLYLNFVPNVETSRTTTRQYHHLQIVIALLCLTIVTVKLSSIGFAIASFGFVAVWAFRSTRHKLPSLVVTRLITLLGLFAVIHVCRGYLLSGAPFFPSPVGGVWSLPWAVEFGVAQNESQLIYAWAKQPGIRSASELATNFNWFNSWFAALPMTLLLLMSFSTLLNLISLGVFLRYRGAISPDLRAVSMIVPVIASLVFWFMTAPDVRFLGAIAILYFIWSLWLVVSIRPSSYSRLKVSKLFLSPTLNVVASLFVLICFVRWSITGLVAVSGWPNLPDVPVAKHSTRSGLAVWVPEQGQQCWNHPLPCAVLAHDSLREAPLLPNWIQQVLPRQNILTTR